MKNENGNIKLYLTILVVILICILTFVFFKISKNEKIKQENIQIKYEYFALYSANEKVGVVNKNGDQIIEPIYTQIYIPNQEKDVFICFDEENNYVILNNKKQELFENFEDVSVIMIAEEILEMEKEALVYKENEKYGLVNLLGEKITEPIYESIKSLKNKPGNLLVKKDGLCGIVDIKGKEIIPTKYNSIKSDDYSSEIDGYAKTGYIISEKTQTGIIFGYVDYTGKVLIKPKNEITV